MTVRIVFDNQVLECAEAMTLAAALIERVPGHERSPECSQESSQERSQESGTRRSVSGEWRAPFCGMGTCFECRVTVDGVAHQRSCQLIVREGMQVKSEVRHEG